MNNLGLILVVLLTIFSVRAVNAQSQIPVFVAQPNGDIVASISGYLPVCAIPVANGEAVASQPFTLVFSLSIPTCQSLPPISEWVNWTREVNYGPLADGRYLVRCIRGYAGFLPLQYGELYLNVVAGQLVPEGQVPVPALSLPGWLALMAGCAGIAGGALQRRRRMLCRA